MFSSAKVFNKISEKVTRPFADAVGSDAYNFSIYNYIKNKIINYIDKTHRYYLYVISGEIINESFLIQDLLKVEKGIQSLMKNSKAKYFESMKYIESLYKDQLAYELSGFEQQRFQDKKFNELKASWKAEMNTDNSLNFSKNKTAEMMKQLLNFR